MNVAEFLYSCAKALGWEAAPTRRSRLRSGPTEVIGVDKRALKLKHSGKLSLADCYLVALAKLRKATVVTADSSIREVAEAPVALIPL